MLNAVAVGEEWALGSLLKYMVWWDNLPVVYDLLSNQPKIFLFGKNQVSSDFKEYDILMEQALVLARILKLNGDAWEVV